jgi:hypothetical protein
MKNWKTSEMTDAHRGKHLKIRVGLKRRRRIALGQTQHKEWPAIMVSADVPFCGLPPRKGNLLNEFNFSCVKPASS